MEKINKKDLADFLEERYPILCKIDSENIINSLFWKIENEIKKGNEVCIVGFGKFFVKELNERLATNPQNGTKFIKEKRKVAKFRTGKNLKNLK